MSEVPYEWIERLVDLGRFIDALPLISSGLATEPENVFLHVMHTRALLGLDRPAEALDAATRATALQPDIAALHRLRSKALGSLRRRDEALAAAAEARRLGPRDWPNHVMYALAATYVGRRLLDAQDAADLAVALAPEQAETHFVAGVVAHERQWFEQAADAYRRALALEPDHAGALHNLAILESGGSLRRRARRFAAVLQVDPQLDQARQHLDDLAARFARRLYWASLAALLIGLVVGSAREGGQPTVASVALAAALCVGVAAYAWSLGRAVPTGVRDYLLPRFTRDPLLASITLLTAAMFGLAVVVCLWPEAGSWLAHSDALRVVGFVNVGMFTWIVVRRVA